MSGREWKPGDVARLRGLGIDTVGIRTEKGAWVWVDRSGSNPIQGCVSLCAGDHPNASPVVVIDPEDGEQVERLTGCLAVNGANPNDRNYWRETQDALREFASPTPPKPDEPTGLGAVVEDAEGHRWLRRHAGDRAIPWANRDTTAHKWRHRDWFEIAAVRVLSEGVTQ